MILVVYLLSIVFISGSSTRLVTCELNYLLEEKIKQIYRMGFVPEEQGGRGKSIKNLLVS